ncbi:hypothetical protein XMM379_002265 [Aliiroseovarius sp. xm-m-379]|uniref:hypothetical protein n=1 Tax=unclassified Aliiroseovarius TaxID=2623558 RepID=UPI0015694308|nr:MULTISPECIES: hypothetical protein [unclassified Aliiroseovarius]NRP13788.1 hypothetical protein [Aliiroseovarius sp. xm-d-517]NRP25567.1 hypothetical protein [Aliiroseovarius sp. xm-m-379]NRP29560.1 hypothetical protein [Aliiroseovarius sp. xm-m-314]NRP34366.1 hypothetical protein [Aliiroseovarius sp. xm-a-104]NRP41675.1 hypothetical protein [Aliiroseovarius sp. xm-m-339-2]
MLNKANLIKILCAFTSAGASFFAAITNAYADTKESGQSLEDELLEIVAYFQPLLPKHYKDGTTTAVKVEARGHVFTYHYVLDTDRAGPLSDEQIATVTGRSCDPSSGAWPYIKKGANIEHSYTNRNGQFLGSFGVNLSNCG